MGKEMEDSSYETIFEVAEMQRLMLEHDRELIKKEQRGEIVVNNRTIEEQEKLLYEKLNAKKINLAYFYSHLRDIFKRQSRIEYYEVAMPCKIIYNDTEEVIPEEYFYSFYIIPLEESQKTANWHYDKELIFYITSRDGKNVYNAGILNGGIAHGDEGKRKLIDSLIFCIPGISVYIDSIL